MQSFFLSYRDFKVNNSPNNEHAIWKKPPALNNFDAELQNELIRDNVINKKQLISSRLRKYFLKENIFNFLLKS